MKYKLRDIAIYSNKKIEVNKINQDTYISTENMLPNKSGVVKATKLPNQSKTNFFENKNILISNIRPYFKKIWYANFNGGCSNDVLNIKIKDETKVLSKYLYYNLLQDSFFEYIMSGSKGTKMPRGDKEHIMEYIIEIPSIDKQTKIVNILDKLNLKIELNNQINNNLLELIKTLYIEKIKNNNDICFEEKTLDEFCNIFTGKKNANASEENGKYKFFTCAPEPLNINSYIYDGPAVIVAGNGAYTGRTNFYNGKFDLYQRTYGITTNNDYIYLFYAMIYTDLQNDIMGGTHGSAIPYIVMKDISKFKIKYNKYIFDELSKKIKVLLLKIKINELENETLTKLRDTLLPRLMNGKINLENIER